MPRTLKLSIADARHYKAESVTAESITEDNNNNSKVIVFSSPVKMMSGTSVMAYAFGVRLKNGRASYIFNHDFMVTLHNAQEKRI